MAKAPAGALELKEIPDSKAIVPEFVIVPPDNPALRFIN